MKKVTIEMLVEEGQTNCGHCPFSRADKDRDWGGGFKCLLDRCQGVKLFLPSMKIVSSKVENIGQE